MLVGQRFANKQKARDESQHRQLQEAILRANQLETGSCVDYRSGEVELITLHELEARLDHYDQERTR